MPQETGKYPTPAVKAISQMDITGNVVPRQWLARLKMPNGTPDPIGVLILAEIIFWYRWTEVLDPATQMVTRYERRFKADKLQKSYQQLSNALGFSKQQVRDAIERLESGGYITKELRNFPTKDGVMLTNVMFLEPVTEAIERLTFTPIKAEELPVDPDEVVETNDAGEVVTSGPYGPGTTPSLPVDHTYTQITTETTTQNTTKIPYPARGAAKQKLSQNKGNRTQYEAGEPGDAFDEYQHPGGVAPDAFLLKEKQARPDARTRRAGPGSALGGLLDLEVGLCPTLDYLGVTIDFQAVETRGEAAINDEQQAILTAHHLIALGRVGDTHADTIVASRSQLHPLRRRGILRRQHRLELVSRAVGNCDHLDLLGPCPVEQKTNRPRRGIYLSRLREG